ncbi:MAG: nuclear transport factor 2 family protein [Bacteroidetes bacterium]|nr:nuclear transport factor 2 family protein [Bacteroidota bacterium]
MNSLKNKQIAVDWIHAFNSKKLEDLLNLYHNSAQHYSPKLKLRKPESNGLIKGKNELRNWWQNAFERLPDLHYKLVKLTSDDEQVFIEYIRQVSDEEDMNVGEVLEIKNGLIVHSRVYHG